MTVTAGTLDAPSTVHFLGLISPPILLFAIPALALAARRRLAAAGADRRRRASPGSVGTWLPFAALSLFWLRTSYLYYMVIVMPGIYLAVARLLHAAADAARWALGAVHRAGARRGGATYPFLALPAVSLVSAPARRWRASPETRECTQCSAGQPRLALAVLARGRVLAVARRAPARLAGRRLTPPRPAARRRSPRSSSGRRRGRDQHLPRRADRRRGRRATSAASPASAALLRAVAAGNRAAAPTGRARARLPPAAGTSCGCACSTPPASVLADVGGPYVIAPVDRRAAARAGGSIGSFVMSVQDDVGFTKLETPRGRRSDRDLLSAAGTSPTLGGALPGRCRRALADG